MSKLEDIVKTCGDVFITWLPNREEFFVEVNGDGYPGSSIKEIVEEVLESRDSINESD